MTVYAVAQLTIHDLGRYRAYASRFLDTMRPYEGKLLVADESPEVVEGEWRGHKVVILEFASAERFREWADSDAYQRIVEDRRGASVGSVILVNGLGGVFDR